MRRIDLISYENGDYVDGIWQDELVNQKSVMASVQPLESSDLRLLPEGDRGKIGWKIFCNFELSMGDGTRRPDELLIDGVIFRISSPENYQFFGHTEATFIEATEEIET